MATVPASVTVPAGASSVNFAVATSAVTASTSATITASYGGVTRTATLTVTTVATDTVGIQQAQYDGAKEELLVRASSTSASATLTVYVTATGGLIGTLTNKGGGKYEGQLSWPVNPQSITVWSSLGGSATNIVTAK